MRLRRVIMKGRGVWCSIRFRPQSCLDVGILSFLSRKYLIESNWYTKYTIYCTDFVYKVDFGCKAFTE